MAYTKVFAIRARLDDRVKYAVNGEKTELNEKIGYAADLVKTNSVRFVTALNCKSAETAFDVMRKTKEKFGKTGGVLGYHFIQSFAPGEVTPEQAHEIGCEFARRLFGEDFEAVIGTHLDKAHPHNHIVVNSVSRTDGHKYLDTQAINPRYSASNVMLAMAQNPEITYINSLEVWNRLGRSVNRDENGMKIRVSDTYVKDGREYHGYKIGRVFDISQTHGKAGVPALSLKDNTPEMDAALRRLLDSSPVPVVTSSTMYQDAVYDPKTQSITVSSRLIDSKIFAALSREIVHAGIHDHGRYPYYTREDCAMDAESVSYMLCRNFGVETPQPDVSRVGQMFDGMEVQDRRGVVDSLQKYFRKLQNDIQREISPQERKQPEQNRPVR